MRQCIAAQEEQSGVSKTVTPANTAAQPQRQISQRKPRLSYKQTRELQAVEEEIAQSEERQKVLQTELSQPSSDAELTCALYTEQQTLEQRLEYLLERWTELETIRSES